MSPSAKNFDILDAQIRVVNYRNLRKTDWLLAGLVLALAVAGIMGLFSASRSGAADYHLKQTMFFLAGVGVAMAIMCIDNRFLVSLGPVMYVVAVCLLALVLILGKEVKGGQRWFALGPLNLQPSEQTKIVVVYMLTWYFTTIGDRIRKLPWFFLAFVITALPMVLILAQPNLGTASVFMPVLVVMLYIAGCRFWHLILVALAGSMVIPLVWIQMINFDPELRKFPQKVKEVDAGRAFYELRYYQKARIYTFLDPEYDTQSSGWQTYQSKITIGSGGMTGKGFCKGTQTYLRYLPEHHNDFIFSLIAEETGFVGGTVVMALFLLLLWRGLYIARSSPDMSGSLLAAGAVTILAFHVFINIGITVGLLPVTGIPLPFLSYGGSFYLTTMICVGVLLNVPVRSRFFE